MTQTYELGNKADSILHTRVTRTSRKPKAIYRTQFLSQDKKVQSGSINKIKQQQ